MEAYALGVQFLQIAAKYIHGLELSRLSARTVVRRFGAHFGVSPTHCGLIWLFTEDEAYKIDPMREKKHLLWCLSLLKLDETENVLHGRWKVDEKTLRKYIYVFLQVLSTLRVVRGQVYECCWSTG